MKLKYKGNNSTVWKEIVISEKDVFICDVGDALTVRIFSTVSGFPLILRYNTISDFLKDWED